MTWLRLSDTFEDDLLGATLADIGLWACAKAYANRALTDGFVPDRALLKFGSDRRGVACARHLAELGYLERDDVRGGYVIVGHLETNPSREVVLAKRAQAVESGRRGGQVKAARPREANAAKTLETHVAVRQPVASSLLAPSRPVPSRPVPEEETERGRALSSAPSGKGGRRKPETSPPPFDSPDLEAWCRGWTIPSPTLDGDVAHFLDHHRRKDNRFRDWAAAWRTWQRQGERLGRAHDEAPAEWKPAPAPPPEWCPDRDPGATSRPVASLFAELASAKNVNTRQAARDGTTGGTHGS